MRVREAGDTLVEVLLATTILGAAVVGALYAMSTGQGIALRSVERTEVQGALNSQLAYLRYARDQASLNNAALWDSIVAKTVPAASSPDQSIICNGATGRPNYSGSQMFYIQESTPAVPTPVLQAYPLVSAGVPVSATTIPAPGEGIWIDAVKGGTSPTEYIDFYVKACWPAASGSQMQESRTVMRLYVPA